MSKAYLSDFPIEKKVFPNLTKELLLFKKADFKKLNEFEKAKKVNELLCKLIKKEKDPCFLLHTVLNFIALIKEKKILKEYKLAHFELWLNQYSKIKFPDTYKIRGKIAGKYIPRDEYQKFFPIGMGKIFEGSHFVTAHKSPDLDSIISSFWGWLDSFAARVSKNHHFWNVPGGLPPTMIETNLLFKNIFSPAIVTLPKKRSILTLSSKDVMTQAGMVLKGLNEHTVDVERDQRLKAVIIIDDNGNYLGDWRSYDVEGVRQIIMLLNTCLRWFENNIHVSLISLFSKKNLRINDIPKFIKKVFGVKIIDCEPAKEFSDKQKTYLNDYLEKVIGVKHGLSATFEEFSQTLFHNKVMELHDFHKTLNVFKKNNLFDSKGNLIENRTKIFEYIEKIIKSLNKALQSIRAYVEKIDIALKIKTDVFGYSPHFISPKSDIDEIKMKLGPRSYLTVNISSSSHNVPIGVVKAQDLRQKFLGTVSFRDFGNFEEIKIASYLQVISVVDHHKYQLNTHTPSVSIISDVQATSVLVAENTMSINDGYSLAQMNKAKIQEQLKNKNNSHFIQSRLLQKKQIESTKDGFFVHAQREFIEYMHFLFGILDDTDLLMKVTNRDVICVANLLNRMKSLMLKKEVEIINFENISKDGNFAQKAAEVILQNKDMYSLYKKVYVYREKEVNKNLMLASKEKESSIFLDVKEQNGCCRIGQTKMFLQNVKTFQKHLPLLIQTWTGNAQKIYQEKPELDLHMHMISTIRGAEEVYKGLSLIYKHKDQLWIWLPKSDLAVEHFKSFLTSFSRAPELMDNDLSLELFGEHADKYEQIFNESFLDIPKKKIKKNISLAVLYFKAGSLNSRKSMISPYLPSITG